MSLHIVSLISGALVVLARSECTYCQACEDTGAKPFALFLTAMAKANLVAIAKLTMREREHLSAIRLYNGLMLLNTLHYTDELRPKAVTVSDKELELANMLIERMKGEFNLADYHDDYREALEKLIEAKIAGQVMPTAPTTDIPATSDVAEAILRSLQLVGAGK